MATTVLDEVFTGEKVVLCLGIVWFTVEKEWGFVGRVLSWSSYSYLGVTTL